MPNIGGSSELTVTVTPASRNARIGCSSSVATARVAMLDDGQTSSGTPVSARWREQRGVLGGGGAVADPLGVQQLQGVPDRLRPGGLAGVRHAVQPGRARPLEVRLELRARHADLGSAEPEADQPLGAVVERVVERASAAGTPNSPGMS